LVTYDIEKKSLVVSVIKSRHCPPLADCTLWCWGDYVVIWGGIRKLGEPENSDFYFYDVDKEVWHRCLVDPPNIKGRRYANGHIIETKLYILGGETGNQYPGDIIVVDLEKHEVNTEVPDQPAPVLGKGIGSALVGKDKIYVYGGIDEDKRCGAELWCLDTTKFTWEKMKMTGEIPGPLSFPSTAVFGDKIFFWNGIKDNQVESFNHSIWMLDTLNNHWTEFYSTNQLARNRTNAVVHETHGYYFGGGYKVDSRTYKRTQWLKTDILPPKPKEDPPNPEKEPPKPKNKSIIPKKLAYVPTNPKSEEKEVESDLKFSLSEVLNKLEMTGMEDKLKKQGFNSTDGWKDFAWKDREGLERLGFLEGHICKLLRIQKDGGIEKYLQKS